MSKREGGKGGDKGEGRENGENYSVYTNGRLHVPNQHREVNLSNTSFCIAGLGLCHDGWIAGPPIYCQPDGRRWLTAPIERQMCYIEWRIEAIMQCRWHHRRKRQLVADVRGWNIVRATALEFLKLKQQTVTVYLGYTPRFL